MPIVDAVVACPLFDSFRVRQLAGMFDVPLVQRMSERFAVDVPELADDWRIGLIVGPSASGKTTIARRLFGERSLDPFAWPRDRAVIDCFGERSIREITGLLTAVGFGSPPSWVKPYHVLSGGERFRCDLARALLTATPSAPGERPLAVCDEYTSVVDRQVARIGSLALAKSLRADRATARLVAVTCHYDVAEWLAPDWTIDMAVGEFQRRRLRRRPLRLEVRRARRDLWPLFARHHYLSGALPRGVRCYAAVCDGAPVAFCAVLALVGYRGRWRISRLVTLPDFQGVGIGTRLAEAVGDWHLGEGLRLNITAAHPALVRHCARSPAWRMVAVKRGGASALRVARDYRSSAGRTVASFEYVGQRGSAPTSP